MVARLSSLNHVAEKDIKEWSTVLCLVCPWSNRLWILIDVRVYIFIIFWLAEVKQYQIHRCFIQMSNLRHFISVLHRNQSVCETNTKLSDLCAFRAPLWPAQCYYSIAELQSGTFFNHTGDRISKKQISEFIRGHVFLLSVRTLVRDFQLSPARNWMNFQTFCDRSARTSGLSLRHRGMKQSEIGRSHSLCVSKFRT